MLETFTGATELQLQEIGEEKHIRRTNELFLLFSLGSQFDHLIKQMLDKLGVFCLVADPASVTTEDVRKLGPIGIILSGGPSSVHTDPPPFDTRIFDLGIPILGICLGFQMWARHIGIPVIQAERREFGRHTAVIQEQSSVFFQDCGAEMQVLESHGDRLENDPRLTILAATKNAPIAAAQYGHLLGVQFHLEVPETVKGMQIFENFCFGVCGAEDRYPAVDVVTEKISVLQEQIRSKKVLLALSGGSDSSTMAYLLKEATHGHLGQLHAVYIKGIDRPDDEAYVREHFGGQDWLELVVVDGTEKFLEALRGKRTGKTKRDAIRGVYREILEEEMGKYGASFIAQGTLYTDLAESGRGYRTGARRAVIKQHHNVDLGFSVPELMPLADCVKDGARNIGRTIGVPEALLTRHPFPGPGLVVRIEGEVNAAKLEMARQLDGIFIEELRRWELYETVWQAGAVVTRSTHTFTKGDDAGSGPVIALWAVWSVNGFTAQAAKLPYDFLVHVERRIGDEVRDVGAVTYRISDKPFSTIEWM
ncbi:GMP synthase (glutamine-hydrolyzing) [Patescibacteria group bacterium]|nr:GMP synthase (glutamine-hydrolyzing) [Patescibacteria group bacterium]